MHGINFEIGDTIEDLLGAHVPEEKHQELRRAREPSVSCGFSDMRKVELLFATCPTFSPQHETIKNSSFQEFNITNQEQGVPVQIVKF